ncbi:Dirigent protein 23 [Sesamum alatum]|uniref:Dirigent protein n=1 Tax=Sesamum alatum TaxID=300844 RepID=A0AAE1YWP9_9LAMI|nr:Dirigent protein 23 [Sesamum alatum]
MVSLFIATGAVRGRAGQDSEESWLQDVCQGNFKMRKLHFFIQDALGGPNATVWEVARSEITSESPSSFGQILVVDDLITATPDPNSMALGRAQGLITSADLQVLALNMNLNFYFTQGEFKGSTLSILGRNPVMETDRELSVVGGTGVFRMARGYAYSHTYSFDTTTDYGILEYNVNVCCPYHGAPGDIEMVTNL